MNVLKGKRLCFLGSSVTYGEAAMGFSFADFIAARNGCSYVKEAVSGTTLADVHEDSYVDRMVKNIDPSDHFDAFICQLSTNDASEHIPLGKISSSKRLEDFDTATVIGAIEYIICYALATWKCPVIFYTGTRFANKQYDKMVELLYELQKKWDIKIIDLWNNEVMNAVSRRDYRLYMADEIHPTRAGYLKWWTPVIEQELYKIFSD